MNSGKHRDDKEQGEPAPSSSEGKSESEQSLFAWRERESGDKDAGSGGSEESTGDMSEYGSGPKNYSEEKADASERESKQHLGSDEEGMTDQGTVHGEQRGESTDKSSKADDKHGNKSRFHLAGKQARHGTASGVTSDTSSSQRQSEAAGLGEKLQAAREASGLSVVEVAQQTKVSAQFINFLEGNKFSQLPPAVYCKSYIRKLAREYKVDPEPLINDYLEHTGQHSRSPSAGGRFVVSSSGNDDSTVGYQPASVERKEHLSILDKFSRNAVLAAIIGLVAVVIAAFAVQQYRNWRISQAEEKLEDGDTPFAEADSIDLEEFIMPRQLPLKELSIPGQEKQ